MVFFAGDLPAKDDDEDEEDDAGAAAGFRGFRTTSGDLDRMTLSTVETYVLSRSSPIATSLYTIFSFLQNATGATRWRDDLRDPSSS